MAVNRSELKALLAFSSTEDSSELYGVQFIVDDDQCYAYASDGQKSVEAIGALFGEPQRGEWFVDKEFLKAAIKLLSGKRQLRLPFAGASLTEARIEDDGIEVQSLSWPKDAASAQASLQDFKKHLSVPVSKNAAHCVTMGAPAMAVMGLLGKAAGTESVDCYMPKKRHEPAIFRLGDDLETTWTACILPWQSTADDDAKAA